MNVMSLVAHVKAFFRVQTLDEICKDEEPVLKIAPKAEVEIPHLGQYHELLVERSKRLFPMDEVNRIKWLKAVAVLQKSPAGYIMEPGNVRPFTGWRAIPPEFKRLAM